MEEHFMKKFLLAFSLVLIFSCVYAADFKGMSVGDYLAYHADTKAQYSEPFFLSWTSPGDIGYSGKMGVLDITKTKGFQKILEQAESIAKSKGYDNFAISNFTFFPNLLYGDFLFW
jgi:hypothetical protein